MKRLYIIAGPNGAGKTTASYTILPDIFDCNEFVNADEIARGLSPFNPESVSIKAGRLMLQRISELLETGKSFSFETTLSTRSYTELVKQAQERKYEVVLLFLALDSHELAIKRVRTRVDEGGHNIPEDIVKRRFDKGLLNLFQLYIRIVDKWILVNNSGENFDFVAQGSYDEIVVQNEELWKTLKDKYYGN